MAIRDMFTPSPGRSAGLAQQAIWQAADDDDWGSRLGAYLREQVRLLTGYETARLREPDAVGVGALVAGKISAEQDGSAQSGTDVARESAE